MRVTTAGFSSRTELWHLFRGQLAEEPVGLLDAVAACQNQGEIDAGECRIRVGIKGPYQSRGDVLGLVF
jgi:hypothetical protein